MSNVLVTGAAGFLGSNLLIKLKEMGHFVIGTCRTVDGDCKLFKCDLTNKDDIKTLFSTFDFDYIFHCAANPLTDISKASLDTILKDNFQATINLLSGLEGTAPDKKPIFVYASSATVYADRVLSSYFGATEISQTFPSSIYGASKLCSEAMIGAYANLGRIVPKICRFCAIVGKDATHGVIKDLCRKYKNDEVVEVIGAKPGTEKPYIHINDAVNGMIKVAFEGKYVIYNIANHCTLTVEAILEIIRKKLGKKEEKWSGGTWVGDNKRVCLANDKTFQDFGWFPKLKSRQVVELVVNEILEGK